jgi:hypothetical protein
MEVKGSEAQGRHREVGSEGSVKQTRGPMNKNRMRGLQCRANEPVIAKPISIKGTGGRSSETHSASPNGKRPAHGFLWDQPIEPPYADPHVRWCGRGDWVTRPPMPIQ